MSTAASPDIAIVSSVQTPYRLHLHLRIAREVPEVTTWSLYTHDHPDQPWELGAVRETRPVFFGHAEGVLGSTNPRHALREWRKGGRIIRWLKERRVACVLVCGYNSPGLLRIIRWGRRAGVPCLLTADSNARADTASGFKRVLKGLVVRRVVRACTGILPFGSLGVEFFRRYGARAEQFFLMPCEPDYDLIARLPDDAVVEERARLGLAPERKRLVFCGRLARVKRVDLAIDAFALIASRRPDWDLVIIGDGPLGPSLRGRVPSELRSRVIWTGFVGDQARISAVYRASHVLVLPSDFEPWGLVVNEAAAAGMALVVSSVVGSGPELVREGVNGRVFRAGELDHLAESLLEATDPDRTDSMRGASARVLEDWRRRADPIDGLRAALRTARVLPADGQG